MNTPVRSAFHIDSDRSPASQRNAESPAIRKAAVKPEAMSMWDRR